MDIIEVRDYCLTLPEVTEDQAFGDDIALLRIRGKIFACIDFLRPELLTLKCNPDYAIDLRDEYCGIIEGAWHWNKKYWNQVNLSLLDDRIVLHLIRHSYNQVILKMPRKDKSGLGLLDETVR